MDKPKNIEEYKKWLKEQHKIEISDRTQTYYNSVTSKIKSDFEKSEFWSQLTKNLKEYNDKYLVKSGYQLLIPNFTPELIIKSFDSFLLKTFRKNIIENNNWPESPENGWILPTNWYSQINDIIRTLIVVKYLDGVEFIINETTQLQEVIRKLLHKYYEERRKRITKEDIKWQWNYKGDEFVANYLGHILHYVEGMIMEIRDKQKEEEII
ncbi:MAG: hypothetical protein KJ714_08055 [Euryarchaeota archaeon]|nr:hypothetical protein [Euryarchaeota archaeon]